jgi:hypothetical protein
MMLAPSLGGRADTVALANASTGGKGGGGAMYWGVTGISDGFLAAVSGGKVTGG